MAKDLAEKAYQEGSFKVHSKSSLLKIAEREVAKES